MSTIVDLSHLDGIRIVDERSSDRNDEFFHCVPI
jgi:hypothetical protein